MQPLLEVQNLRTYYLRERYPQIQVLILTSFPEDELIQRALKAGATGYLLKNVNMKELAAAVRAAHHGRLTLAPEAAQSLMHAATHREVPVPGNDLTERERQVLCFLVRGMENNKIADLLMLSHSTVKFHVSNILSKLHATNRTKAVIVALKHKLVSQQPLLDLLVSRGCTQIARNRIP
jgi:NarL family two-component system response regulator LiaR